MMMAEPAKGDGGDSDCMPTYDTLAEDGEQQSFQDLLRQLSTVHEQQQEAIRRLSQENSFLKERLEPPTPEAPEALPDGPPSAAVQGLLLRDPGKLAGERSSAQPIVPFDDTQIGSEVPDDSESETEMSCECEMNSQMTTPTLAWPIPSLWPDWEDQPGAVQHIMTKSSFTHLIVVEEATGQRMTMVDQYYQRLVIRPNSALRLCWDFLSSFMVAYDVVTIPLMAISMDKTQVLGGGTGDFTEVMDWVTTTFWSVDMIWSFLTGFNSDGLVEMRGKEVAKNYLKTWFLFDFLIIVLDWSLILAASGSTLVNMIGWLRAGKTARIVRILRTVRLLRFVKLQQALCEALELINSENIRAFFNVALAVLFIFGINHYLACGWFFMGHLAWSTDQPNWIVVNEIDKCGALYAYFTALHWSLTQFTPAGMEIRPYNLGERVYSIVCLVFALICFSSFLGSITASITQLRKHSTEATRQKHVLRTYFLHNNVSTSLSKAIWSYLNKNHFCHQVRSHKEQVQILRLLPPNLQGRLHQELYSPYITRAPFFYHYVAFSSEGLTEVCLKSITERSLIRGETLFMGGKVAEKMYFTASGYLHYEHLREEHKREVGAGSWISEAVLWVKWVHIATMSANTSAEIVELDSSRFRSAVSLYKRSVPFVQVYAQHFHEYMQALGPEHQTDLLMDVCDLEMLTRSAWYEVCSARERGLFVKMPSAEDRESLSRNDRLTSVLWHKPKRASSHGRSSYWRKRLGLPSRMSWSSSAAGAAAEAL